MLNTRATLLMAGGVVMLALWMWGAARTGAMQPAAAAPDPAAQGPAPAGQAGDLIRAGGDLHVDDEIEGDAIVAGEDVEVAGPVSGYVMAAGRHVRIDGSIGNDLWAAAETVTVDTSIGDNARVAARTVHLMPGTSVARGAWLAGETVTAAGRVERELRIAATTARIGADVGGSVRVQAARVILLPGATVRGDLIVRAPEPPEIAPDAQVLGQVRHEAATEAETAWVWTWLLGFVALLIFGFAALAVSRNRVAAISGTLRARFGRSLLTGILLLILVPIAAVLLLVTVVGIPLGLTMLALYAAALLLSAVFVSYRLGEWMLSRLKPSAASPWGRMALGALVVSLGGALPAVGWLVVLAVIVMGAGALAVGARQAA